MNCYHPGGSENYTLKVYFGCQIEWSCCSAKCEYPSPKIWTNLSNEHQTLVQYSITISTGRCEPSSVHNHVYTTKNRIQIPSQTTWIIYSDPYFFRVTYSFKFKVFFVFVSMNWAHSHTSYITICNTNSACLMPADVFSECLRMCVCVYHSTVCSVFVSSPAERANNDTNTKFEPNTQQWVWCGVDLGPGHFSLSTCLRLIFTSWMRSTRFAWMYSSVIGCVALLET